LWFDSSTPPPFSSVLIEIMDSNTIIKAAGGTLAASALLSYVDSKLFISKDFSLARKLIAVKKEVEGYIKQKKTVADLWESTVDRFPTKTFVVFEGFEYSYATVDGWANQIAHWLQSKGIGQQDVVALYMGNKPQFVATWLGVVKLGAVCAMINNSVTGKSLVHCIQVAGAKLIIIGDEQDELFSTAAQACRDSKVPVVSYGGAAVVSSANTHLDAELNSQPVARIPRSQRNGIGFTSKALLVYTSGTTGLPKAATITSLRAFISGGSFAKLVDLSPEDRYYNVLPLYHSAGGLVVVVATMVTGNTMVLKRKFSATTFWDDCREHKITCFQYIGELCRYLLNVPARPNDNVNKIRVVIGNGLRPEIWAEFQRRFAIPMVCEFYGSADKRHYSYNRNNPLVQVH
jgi:fatty-acyl-CoA synthase